ncbi:MAG: UDP-3-O-(3-hydroxymyristoyl)glucosamine N-acyltransferase [Saprospiraceae bacterium]
MQFEQQLPITYFAEKYELTIVGNKDLIITGLNEIHKVKKGNLTFVDVEKYFQKSILSDASAIIINKLADFPEGKALLLCADPFKVYNQIAKDFRPFRPIQNTLYEGVQIGEGTLIEPNVHIGDNVVIGKNVYIQPGVYIGNDTVVGDNVRIQAGAIIGSDAFYYKKQDKKYTKWHSCGRVILENDVEIGAGCTVNKGVSGDTIIGEGSKLDSQVHIAHGVVLGKHCLLAAQVGIAGKTIVGDYVVMYGQVGIAQALTIGEGAVILAKSGVSKSLEPNKVYFGIPAAEAREKYKEIAKLRMISRDDISLVQNVS